MATPCSRASRHGDRVCVHRLSFDDSEERTELLCRPSADHAPYLFVVDRPNEETGHYLLLANPRGKLGDYELVVVDPTDGTVLSIVDTTSTHLEPRQVDRHRILLSSRALTLVDLHAGVSASLDETDFGGFVNHPQVVRPTDGAPFVLALRGQRHHADVHELVRVTLPDAL